MHTYKIMPIDFGWENLPTVSGVAAQLAASDARAVAEGHSPTIDPGSQELLLQWSLAKDAAAAAGWDGDFRGQPRVFWVPEEGRFAAAFVLKQDNNGTTFVVSPHPLPHLEQL